MEGREGQRRASGQVQETREVGRSWRTYDGATVAGDRFIVLVHGIEAVALILELDRRQLMLAIIKGTGSSGGMLVAAGRAVKAAPASIRRSSWATMGGLQPQATRR